MGISNFKMCSLREVLGEKLIIPKYQRAYAWERSNNIDLWDDICYLVSNNAEMHFFGQIVVHKDKEDHNKLFIIDGQQRITTSVLLVRAFLNQYSKIYKKMDASSTEAQKLNRKIVIMEQMIGFNSTENYSNQSLNLTQNTLDNEFFIKLLCLDEDTLNYHDTNKKSSKVLLKNSYNYFEKQVKFLIKDKENLNDRLLVLDKYFEKFTNQFKVMYLEDDNLAEAYTIFETLNDRGKDLASTDLLKNYILANSRDINISYNKWNSIISNLSGCDVTKYIRHFWNSRFTFTREKNLYSNISAELDRSCDKCDNFLDLLNECSSFYHDISDPDNASVITDRVLLSSLKALKTMRSATWYPILIAMFMKKNPSNQKIYSWEDIAKVSKDIETYVFKNFVICSNNPNESETQFASIANNISSGTFSVEDISKLVRTNLVKDSIFKTIFTEFAFEESDKEIIRYFFRTVHKHLDTVHEINMDNTEVHIEHIMPKNIDQWDESVKAYHDDYLWRVGNLCLLSGPLNQEIQNKPFADKKELAYKDSLIKPNNELLGYEDWTKVEIDDRQNKLLDLVNEIWM